MIIRIFFPPIIILTIFIRTLWIFRCLVYVILRLFLSIIDVEMVSHIGDLSSLLSGCCILWLLLFHAEPDLIAEIVIIAILVHTTKCCSFTIFFTLISLCQYREAAYVMTYRFDIHPCSR